MKTYDKDDPHETCNETEKYKKIVNRTGCVWTKIRTITDMTRWQISIKDLTTATRVI